MTRGLPSANHPSENTLTVNITHEQLATFQSIGFENSVAVSPTRVKESDYAYDVAMDWDWAKVFIQQYKRPDAETGSIQNKKGTEGHVKFSPDGDQITDLKREYDEGEAFLTLPLVRDRQNMPDNLADTIFVDVHGIPDDSATIIYILDSWRTVSGKLYKTNFSRDPDSDIWIVVVNPESKIPQSYITKSRNHVPAVHLKLDDSISTIPPKWIKTWDRLLSELLTCESGILLRVQGDHVYYQDEEAESNSASAVLFGGNRLPRDVSW